MLSLILPNYQHFEITKAHIKQAMKSTLVPDEIIVVNDGGDPILKDIISDIKDRKCPIKYAYILPPKIIWNYNGAVNLGVWLSRGDYLAIEDNDNIPQPTFYEEAIKLMEEDPSVGRVYGLQRHDFSVKDIEKPSDQWILTGKRGPNQGSYVMRRDVYTKLKGGDERMCGRYGWMYCDWRSRMLGKAKIKFGQRGYFWYVTDGQSELSRHNANMNYRIYKQNAQSLDMHHEHGILNFRYTIEVL